MQATITKTQAAQTMGEYQLTSVDRQRETADIVITGHYGRNTEIRTRKLLSGPGIKLLSVQNGIGQYAVRSAAMDELRRRFRVATDF